MSTFAKSKFGALLATIVVALALTVRASADDVVSPNKRTEALSSAKALLSVKEGATAAKDPFHSEAFAEAVANSAGISPGKLPTDVGPNKAPSGPRSNRDALQAIAASLKPRYLELGGQPILFFGQKRVKAGDMLTINFEGADYALEVVSIEKPNFTLRLNRDEFTRPIK
jgi:hypothetical protein